MMKKKFIISGPPGSGKTTLINALSKKGIPCIHEVARDIIVLEQASNGNGTPWQNVERFSELVFKETLIRLDSQKDSLFCDRSLIDNIAYLGFYNATISNELNTFEFKKFYHNTVFFATPWEEIYVKDAQRPQEFSESIELSKQLIDTYRCFGFTIEFIPLASVTRRIDFILDKIQVF
jgi:predicted ATPase